MTTTQQFELNRQWQMERELQYYSPCPFWWQVFLKYYHVERLWQILSSYERHATKMQKLVRGFLARREAQGLWRQKRERVAAIIIQAGTKTDCLLDTQIFKIWFFCYVFQRSEATGHRSCTRDFWKTEEEQPSWFKPVGGLYNDSCFLSDTFLSWSLRASVTADISPMQEERESSRLHSKLWVSEPQHHSIPQLAINRITLHKPVAEGIL